MNKYFIQIDFKQELGVGHFTVRKLAQIIDADLDRSSLYDICRKVLEEMGIDIDETPIEVNQFNLL